MTPTRYRAGIALHAGGQPSRKRMERDKLLVLVVDDYEDLRFMLRVVLERRGFEVVEAANGLEAVEVAGKINPNLILMDCGLPLLDGLSATRRIRQQELLRAVPIVALSGDARPHSPAIAFEAGCTGYLVKPFALETLNELLDQHLNAQLNRNDVTARLEIGY